MNNEIKYENEHQITLALMPFWSPLTPPLGISCLKAFLDKNGYKTKAIDFNTELILWEFSNQYLSMIKKNVPENLQGNVSMIGYDVLTNHLNTYNTCSNREQVEEILSVLIEKNYFYTPSEELLNKLIDIIEEFYFQLRKKLDDVFGNGITKIFGISVYSLTLGPSIFTFKYVKEKYPNVITVMGGGIFADQLSLNSKDFKYFQDNTPYIDHILVGEGELLWLYLLNNNFNVKKVLTLDDINITMDFNEAPIPDFSDFNINDYIQLAAYASRSCPFQCSFCSETVQWGNYRKKNVSQIINEMFEISNRYEKYILLFGDSLLNPLITELSLELLKYDKKIYWDAYIRVSDEAGDYEIVKLWRNAGFYRARLGIESGSQSVLNLMNKKTNINQIKTTIMNLASAGIKVTTYWVIGHPGETDEYFQETLDLLQELKDYIYEADFHPFYFYPSGQVSSDEWTRDNGYRLLYPEEYSHKLIVPTWILDNAPPREVIYNRLQRFSECCKKCGIPNPYTFREMYEADKRWEKLHENSVPFLIELQ